MARLAGLAVPPRRPGGPTTSPQPSRQACTSALPAGAGLGGGSPPSPQLALRSWSRFEQDLVRLGCWSRELRWGCGEFDPRNSLGYAH